MVMVTIILDQGRSYYSLAFVKKAPARPRVAKPPKILITINIMIIIIMLVDDYLSLMIILWIATDLMTMTRMIGLTIYKKTKSLATG